jgi:hypothetical protein
LSNILLNPFERFNLVKYTIIAGNFVRTFFWKFRMCQKSKDP